jgi:hypothetical protein
MPAGMLLDKQHINESLNLPKVFELYWHKSQAESFSALKN